MCRGWEGTFLAVTQLSSVETDPLPPMCCLHPDVERVEEEIYPPHCHPFKTRFWWVKVFNSTFNNIFSNIMAVSVIGGGNQSTHRKLQTCCKSLTNYHIMLYWVLVIGTDCISSHKSNYHTITTMMTPPPPPFKTQNTESSFVTIYCIDIQINLNNINKHIPATFTQ